MVMARDGKPCAQLAPDMPGPRQAIAINDAPAAFQFFMLDPSRLVFVTGQAGQRLTGAPGAGPVLPP
jgi:hypothetical protein